MAEYNPEDMLQVFKGQSLAFVANWIKSKGLQKLCTNWLLMGYIEKFEKPDIFFVGAFDRLIQALDGAFVSICFVLLHLN